MRAPAVSLRHITKKFGRLVANDDVSLDLVPGETNALVGENGAGKSTLMRVLYGLLPPDAGTIEVDGRATKIASPAHAMKLGLGMVHQHFMLVGPLTVAENVVLGHEPHDPLGALSRKGAEATVAELSERYRLPVDPRARIDDLSVGAQQRVEILKALHHGARVLILDEPTAVLTPQEVDELFQVLRGLQADGTTIVLITHKLAEVKALAQQVTVMRAGRVVGAGRVSELSIGTIAEWMIGRAIPELSVRAERRPEVPLLDVRMLDVLDDRGLPAVRKASFAVRGGEIVGIAGVDGNGQAELVECLAGLRPPLRGEIRVADRRVSGRSAREHTRSGIAHIPSDRLERGIIVDMTLAENLILGRQREPAMGEGPFLDPRALGLRAKRLLVDHDVRPAEPFRLAGKLSGGNQQKLVVARELSRAAPVLLAAHPTRGVDLGAVLAIHRRLLAERDIGRAVLLVSSELSEILALSDRLYVMFEGRLVHETRPNATDERTLGLHMAGRIGPALGER
jgi:general nucleoside transport system ATP-binding protein